MGRAILSCDTKRACSTISGVGEDVLERAERVDELVELRVRHLDHRASSACASLNEVWSVRDRLASLVSFGGRLDHGFEFGEGTAARTPSPGTCMVRVLRERGRWRRVDGELQLDPSGVR